MKKEYFVLGILAFFAPFNVIAEEASSAMQLPPGVQLPPGMTLPAPPQQMPSDASAYPQQMPADALPPNYQPMLQAAPPSYQQQGPNAPPDQGKLSIVDTGGSLKMAPAGSQQKVIVVPPKPAPVQSAPPAADSTQVPPGMAPQ